ncbi:MAG: AsmA-like C-terminal domain-containing protein [Sedimentisphaerales bacterium]|nr:AsmA-like C-terminal domain-containing protein [Sedimentisphaerales bacterium]
MTGEKKKILSRVYKALVIIIVLAVVFAILLRFLPDLAIIQIARLTNTRITISSADFNLDGSVLIKELVVRPAFEHRRNKIQSSSRTDEKDFDTILKADTVYARFNLMSLLLLRPNLKSIRINNFLFNALYNADLKTWNISNLKIKRPGAHKKMVPSIHLYNGVLQYSRFSDSTFEVIAAAPVNVTIEPYGDIAAAYSFDISTSQTSALGRSRWLGLSLPGNITIAGSFSSTHIPAFDTTVSMDALAGQINYDNESNYSLNFEIQNLLSRHKSGANDVTGSTAYSKNHNPLTALQKFCNRYQPQGLMDVEFQAQGNLKQPFDSNITGQVYCKNISICDKKFPYALDKIIGQIFFTEDSFSMKNLPADHNDVKFTLNIDSVGIGAERCYQRQIKSKNLRLDDDLYNALSQKQKKLWSAFSPSGAAAINSCYSRSGQSRRAYALAVELLGAQATYRNFPYPLKNLTGNLLFDHNSITISDVVTEFGNSRVAISGQITDCNTQRPNYDIAIKADSIPINSTLAAALPAEQKQFVQQYSVKGRIDADIKILTLNEEMPPATYIADVIFKDASLTIPPKSSSGANDVNQLHTTEGNLPWLEISDVTASVVFAPDIISIEDSTGRTGQAKLSLTGQIWPTAVGSARRYCLLLIAEKLTLQQNITNVLPKTLYTFFDQLRPKGKINCSANLNQNAPEDCPVYKITLDCLGNTIRIEPIIQPLTNVTGTVVIAKDSLELQDFNASIMHNHKLQPYKSKIQVSGRVNFSLAEEPNRPLQPSAGYLNVLTNKLKIKGKSISDIQTGFIYDKNQNNWIAEDFFANFYDGRLSGTCEFENPVVSTADQSKASSVSFYTSQYVMHVGFENIDLKKFLADKTQNLARKTEISPSTDHTTGKMFGSLSVSGRIKDEFPSIGRCRFRIINMEIGKLSPLAKLLQVLKLTEPTDYAFGQMLVDSYLIQDHLLIEKFDLSGQGIAFKGSGSINLKENTIDLTLTARGERIATDEPTLLQSLTEGLGQAVVQVHVTGDLYDPTIKTETLPLIRQTLQILGSKQN